MAAVKSPAGEPIRAKPTYAWCIEHYGASRAEVGQILRHASRLIRTGGMARRCSARAECGAAVYSTDPRAVVFSVGGAIVRATAERGAAWQDGLAAEAAMVGVVEMPIVSYSDTPGLRIEDVTEAFLRAIWRAENYRSEAA